MIVIDLNYTTGIPTDSRPEIGIPIPLAEEIVEGVKISGDGAEHGRNGAHGPPGGPRDLAQQTGEVVAEGEHAQEDQGEECSEREIESDLGRYGGHGRERCRQAISEVVIVDAVPGEPRVVGRK